MRVCVRLSFRCCGCLRSRGSQVCVCVCVCVCFCLFLFSCLQGWTRCVDRPTGCCLLGLLLSYCRKAPGRHAFQFLLLLFGLTRFVSDQCSALFVTPVRLASIVCVCVFVCAYVCSPRVNRVCAYVRACACACACECACACACVKAAIARTAFQCQCCVVLAVSYQGGPLGARFF